MKQIFRSIGIFTFLGSIALGQQAFAQDVEQVFSFDTTSVAQMRQRFTARLSPAVKVLDATNNIARIIITNPGSSKLKVALSLEYTIVSTGSTGNFITTIDSNSTKGSASIVEWVNGIPSSITLGPKQTDTIVATVILPQKIGASESHVIEYWARLIATSPSVKKEVRTVVMQTSVDSIGKRAIMQFPTPTIQEYQMISTTVLIYRTLPTTKSESSVKLNATTATLMPDGDVLTCTLLTWNSIRLLTGSIKLQLSSYGMNDTVVRTVPLNLTPGSGATLKPCLKSSIPLSMSGTITATLLVESDSEEWRTANAGQFSSVQTFATFERPVSTTRLIDGTMRYRELADANVAKSSGQSVKLVDLNPADGPLHDLLSREYAIAKQEDKVLLVEVGAAWCGPCVAFIRSLSDSLMIDALSDVRLVAIDFNKWGQSFVNGKYLVPSALPLFFIAQPDGTEGVRLDINSRWGAKVAKLGYSPEAMAPGLKDFIREVRARQ